MTDLHLDVLTIGPQRHAAAPHLLFRLAITESTGVRVHAVALRCQLMIEPARRRYEPDEQRGLTDLFGSSERYASTLRPFLWSHATALVQGFEGLAEFDLPVACTYDFDVSATKYLHALRDGSVPLSLLFSGTVFTRGTSGFAAENLSWALEARCDMPVGVWRELMDLYFPGGGWIRLDREALDVLVAYRAERGLTSWEATVSDLVASKVGAS